MLNDTLLKALKKKHPSVTMTTMNRYISNGWDHYVNIYNESNNKDKVKHALIIMDTLRKAVVELYLNEPVSVIKAQYKPLAAFKGMSL